MNISNITGRLDIIGRADGKSPILNGHIMVDGVRIPVEVFRRAPRDEQPFYEIFSRNAKYETTPPEKTEDPVHQEMPVRQEAISTDATDNSDTESETDSPVNADAVNVSASKEKPAKTKRAVTKVTKVPKTKKK